MSWACHFPEDLMSRALGLVALTGLNVTHNAVHREVWDSFVNRRREDRVPLKFVNLPSDYEYPKCKTKRLSYEWCIPKGILRCDWLSKHLNQVPALIVIFFDVEWNCPQWDQRLLQYNTTVEIVRNTVVGRNTKIAVVLIQNNDPVPPGEDITSTMSKFSMSICQACSISSKNLFVLPSNDHLIGYTIRIENKFYELCQSYYQSEIKSVKAHRDQVNKTTHQLLFVRHQFKIAFYSEQRNDTSMARKHYTQAYRYLQELPFHQGNMLEVKTVAGYLCYKICKLAFFNDDPFDAINQFRKHVDFFKTKIGRTELKFEHNAWMSKQFEIFANLFEESIGQGLKAMKVQQPGFYYHLAAEYLIKRKHDCRVLCRQLPEPIEPDPCANIGRLMYYGQRPWREQSQSLEAADGDLEIKGIQVLQHLEAQSVNHSQLIIPLFTSAIKQFTLYGSTRITLQLMVHLATEHYELNDNVTALSILNRVMSDYRKEKWWIILTPVLLLALKCAYLNGNQKEYIHFCIELISKASLISDDEKRRIQTNLFSVINEHMPQPETNLMPGHVTVWNTNHSCIPFSINMTSLHTFVECKVCFSDAAYDCSDNIDIDICIQNNAPAAVVFDSLYVNFNNKVYDTYCRHDKLSIQTNEHSVVSFTLRPVSEDINTLIHVNTVTCTMGNVNLRWAYDNVLLPEITTDLAYNLWRRPTEQTQWTKIINHPIAEISNCTPKVQMKLLSNETSLVNESFPIVCELFTDTAQNISNIGFSFFVNNKGENKNLCSLSFSPNDVKMEQNFIEDKPQLSINKGEKIEKIVYLTCLDVCEANVLCKVNYEVKVHLADAETTCNLEIQKDITLPVVQPFNFSAKFKSMKFNNIDHIYSGDNFILATEITNTFQSSLIIEKTEFNLNQEIAKENNLSSQLNNVELDNDEVAMEMHAVKVETELEHAPMGMYDIIWRRPASTTTCRTSVQLPLVSVRELPVCVQVSVSACSQARCHLPLHVNYRMSNRTRHVCPVTASLVEMDPAAFIYSGYKQLHVRLLPYSHVDLSYLLVPLIHGEHRLPLIRVNQDNATTTNDRPYDPQLPDKVIKYQQRMQTSSLYIQPS